jgi:hypothetical protein
VDVGVGCGGRGQSVCVAAPARGRDVLGEDEHVSPKERLAKAQQAQTIVEELLADMNDNGPDEDEYALKKLVKAFRALDYVARHWKRVSEEGGE